MAIIADVRIQEENGENYIRIAVGEYPFPISYRGSYYIRSGSTTQELTGNALDEFILRKHGKTWDGVPVPFVEFEDFESDAFKVFRKKAIARSRLTPEDLDITDEQLLDTLRLTEGKYLKRAALLLFHQDPEKWVQGAYVKIGMFANEADLLYQHEVHGPLITMPDKVIDIIYSNYFKGMISYEGIQRVENWNVPQGAFTEAITNAICHRDYSTGIPIQIKVFPDRVIIYNDGCLSEKWTLHDVLNTHRSEPHNPAIATAFFRAGIIESWGRGITNIKNACETAGKPEPTFEFKRDREFSVTFFTGDNIANTSTERFANGDIANDPIKDLLNDPIKDLLNDPIKDLLNSTQQELVSILAKSPHLTIKELADKLQINERNARKNIKVLKDMGIVERVGSKKSGSWLVKL
ncbi:MAG: HTH domain-containing protein [Defluviitaleaceae bacterium]|nr:HTH domain-containing protein [Defluviitaleaceae bacterium]MCL2239943.1 HTH domain-containing protein [Defluviitaleaceae bacterium]